MAPNPNLNGEKPKIDHLSYDQIPSNIYNRRILQLKPLNQWKYYGNVTRFNTVMHPLYTHMLCNKSGWTFLGGWGISKIFFFFLLLPNKVHTFLNFHLLWFNIVLNITPVSLKLNDAYFDPIQELGSHCQCIQLVNKVIVFWPPDFKRNIFCIMKSPAYWTTCHENVNYWRGEVGGGEWLAIYTIVPVSTNCITCHRINIVIIYACHNVKVHFLRLVHSLFVHIHSFIHSNTSFVPLHVSAVFCHQQMQSVIMACCLTLFKET